MMTLLPSRTRPSITWEACGPSGTLPLYVVWTLAPNACCAAWRALSRFWFQPPSLGSPTYMNATFSGWDAL